jgi:hypothetical protein
VQHNGSLIGDISETTGPSFDPSGTRFYFSSQRAGIAGVTYEVRGPWRGRPDATLRPDGKRVTIQPKPQEVKVSVRRSIRRRRLKERGLPVTITLDTRSSISLELRGRNAKGRRVVVAKATADGATPERVRLVLKPKRGVRNLKKRLTLVATVTESVGRSATKKRRITLRG